MPCDVKKQDTSFGENSKALVKISENSKLTWVTFVYNLVILIKKCKFPYQNFGKALFSRNQVFCLKS